MATIARYRVSLRELALTAISRGGTAITESRRRKIIVVTWQQQGHGEVLGIDSDAAAGMVPDNSCLMATVFGPSSAGRAAVDGRYARGADGEARETRDSSDGSRPCWEGLMPNWPFQDGDVARLNNERHGHLSQFSLEGHGLPRLGAGPIPYAGSCTAWTCLPTRIWRSGRLQLVFRTLCQSRVV